MQDQQAEKSQIKLRENIPLSTEDLKFIETQQKQFSKAVPIVLGICVFITMGFIAYCIKEDFEAFKYYDYILFFGGGLAMFEFIYLIAWLLNKYDNYNWGKDKLYGKNRLATIIISRDKNKYGGILTFAENSKNKRVRLSVTLQDYRNFKKNDKVIVTYFRYNRKVIDITGGETFVLKKINILLAKKRWLKIILIQ